MNTPVKKLFGAPWETDGTEVTDRCGRHIALLTPNDAMAQLITYLPELYDALLDAVWHRCYYCGRETPLATGAILEHGCLKEAKEC